MSRRLLGLAVVAAAGVLGAVAYASAGQQGPSGSSVFDTFSYSNGPLSATGNWSALLSSTTPSVSSGTATCTLVSICDAYWQRAQSYGPDAEAFLNVVTKPGNGNTFRLYVRVASAGGSATGYLLSANDQSGVDQFAIVRMDAGTNVNLAVGSQEYAAGDEIGFTAVGSTLTGWWRSGGTGAWSAVATATDATYSAAGRIGFGVYGTTGAADDFGGGDYVPASGASTSTVTVSTTVTTTDAVTVTDAGVTTTLAMGGSCGDTTTTPAQAPCVVSLDAAGSTQLDLIWWGVGILAGFVLVLLVAPMVHRGWSHFRG